MRFAAHLAFSTQFLGVAFAPSVKLDIYYTIDPLQSPILDSM
jgi:hypothetical protein